MNEPGRRQQRLGELIKSTLSEALQELKDPRLEMITITRVNLAKDLKSARVFFSVLGDEERQNKALEGLKHCRGRLQAMLHDELSLRYTPILHFQYDPAIAGSIHISALLREALGETSDQEDGEDGEDSGGEDGPEPEDGAEED